MRCCRINYGTPIKLIHYYDSQFWFQREIIETMRLTVESSLWLSNNQIPQTTVTDRQPQNMHNYSQLTAHFPALVNNFHHWKMNEYHAFSRILHFISHINWQILHKLIINLPNWLTLHIPNTVRLNKLRIYRMGIKQTCSMKMTNSYWSQS